MTAATASTRVLHLVSTPDRRGAQVFASQLAASLGGPLDQTVIAVEPGTTANRLPIAQLGSRRWDVAGIARLVAGLRRYDVLVAHGSSALLHGAFASLTSGRPFIYRNIGDPASWGAVRAAQLRIGAPLRRAAAVVSLYPDAAEHLGSAYRLRPGVVHVIPNAVPVVEPPTDDERHRARNSLGLDPDRRWCGFLGALSEEKGVFDAIRAVASDPDLGLVVAGAGPLDDAARRLAADIAPDAVVFLGVVERPKDMMAAVDVLLIPSRTEGIPAAAIEAGLAEVPVVATSVGGVPSVVLDGRTGVLVTDTSPQTLRAGIDRAMQRRDEWGTAARRHCLEHFTLESVAAEWARLIDTVRLREEGGDQTRRRRASSR